MGSDLITILIVIVVCLILNWLGKSTEDATFPLLGALAVFLDGAYVLNGGLTVYLNWVVGGAGSNYIPVDATPLLLVLMLLGIGSVTFAYHLAAQ